MRYATPALVNLLRSNTRLPFANCFTIVTQYGADIGTLAAKALGNPVGETFFYTNSDADVQVGNHIYSSSGLIVKGLRYKLVRGLQIDEQSVTIYANSTDTINGVPFLQAVVDGVLDGARLQQSRAFFDPTTWPARPGKPNVAVGAITLFSGGVTTVDDVGRTSATFKVKSDLSLLDVEMPHNLYQASCMWTLFDENCGLDLKLFQVNAVVTSTSTQTVINWTNSRPTDYFAQGVMRFTSGENANISRPVRSSSASGVVAVYPFPHVPANGDTFLITPGCDHTKDGAQGCPKYKNQRNFRGFPYVPPPETGI